MGDGRCLTSYDASKLMNDFIMKKNGIAYEDNFQYRTFLQRGGVEAVSLPIKNAACGKPLRFGSF